MRLLDWPSQRGLSQMQALSALTPPLLVCAVVVIAIVAFLRHEMGRSRADRSADGDEAQVPALPRSAEPDRRQNEATETSRESSSDSGPVSRRLR
jgi:hypothetical protein